MSSLGPLPRVRAGARGCWGTSAGSMSWWGGGHDWVTEEEAERLANEGDLILAPSSSYPLEPERQGKLLWITGLPLSKIHQIFPKKISVKNI